jgi:hypothetical protein
MEHNPIINNEFVDTESQVRVVGRIFVLLRVWVYSNKYSPCVYTRAMLARLNQA